MITQWCPLIARCVMLTSGPGKQRSRSGTALGEHVDTATAVIIVRRDGVPTDVQQAACLTYCEAHRYKVDSITYNPGDAAAIVEAGTAQVVVAAYRRSEDRAMDRRVRQTAGRVEYVRGPVSRHDVTDVDLVAAMHERGASVEQIADLLGESTREISARLSSRRL